MIMEKYSANKEKIFNALPISILILSKFEVMDLYPFDSAKNRLDRISKKYQEMKPWIFETTDNGRNNPDNKVKLKAALHIRLIKKYV